MSSNLKRYRASFCYEGRNMWDWVVASSLFEVQLVIRARYPGVINIFIVED